MSGRILTDDLIKEFKQYLNQEEKSGITVEKYLRDVEAFRKYANMQEVTKELVVSYKKHLNELGYAVRSINSMLASINSFLKFRGWADCQAKSMKTQRQIYCAEDKELTKEEYIRLLDVAKTKPRIYLVMQTICSTGIRVSELSYFTVEEVRTTRPGRQGIRKQ